MRGPGSTTCEQGITTRGRGGLLSRDPAEGQLEQPASFEPYVFANSNPYILRDPTGEFSLSDFSVASTVRNVLRRPGARSAGCASCGCFDERPTCLDVHHALFLIIASSGISVGSTGRERVVRTEVVCIIGFYRNVPRGFLKGSVTPGGTS